MEEDTNHFKETIKAGSKDENLSNAEIDTKQVAQELHLALAAGKSTIKVRTKIVFYLIGNKHVLNKGNLIINKIIISFQAFSEAIGINRNYFSNLLKYPVSWDKATKLQKFAFACVSFWLNFMKV